MPAFKPKKINHFFRVNQWLKQLFAGRALLGPRADHTPLPCWLHPKGRNSKGSRCTWAWFLIENAGNSVFWCFSNGLFDGVLTIFLEGLMLLRFSLMVLFMVDGLWLFVWRVFGLLALMVLRWFLMVSAIPVWGLLCTHRSIHLGLINWNNLPCVSIHTSSTSANRSTF